MDRWTVDYVDNMTREALENSFVRRRATLFPPSRDDPNFNWDEATGMVVRAWMYARDNPRWMQEVPFEETTERFAELMGWAAEKTTQTFGMNAMLHVKRQRRERELVTDFVLWALQGVNA